MASAVDPFVDRRVSAKPSAVSAICAIARGIVAASGCAGREQAPHNQLLRDRCPLPAQTRGACGKEILLVRLVAALRETAAKPGNQWSSVIEASDGR